MLTTESTFLEDQVTDLCSQACDALDLENPWEVENLMDEAADLLTVRRQDLDYFTACKVYRRQMSYLQAEAETRGFEVIFRDI